jgi:hypothetical protein
MKKKEIEFKKLKGYEQLEPIIGHYNAIVAEYVDKLRWLNIRVSNSPKPLNLEPFKCYQLDDGSYRIELKNMGDD